MHWPGMEQHFDTILMLLNGSELVKFGSAAPPTYCLPTYQLSLPVLSTAENSTLSGLKS